MLGKVERQEEEDPIAFFDAMSPKGVPTWDDGIESDPEVEKLFNNVPF